MQSALLVLAPGDNVGVATAPLPAASPLPGGGSVTGPIEPGHKVALQPIELGAEIVKYGQVIGRATRPIPAGAHVHGHNCAFDAARHEAGTAPSPLTAADADRARTFQGYRRADGRTGTRNFIGVIASVNCSTTVCRVIAERANRDLLPRFPGLDGFVPILHDLGCGMSGSGEGMKVLHRTIGGYAKHPNFGGVLMIGLGCEMNQIALYGAARDPAAQAHFNIQDAGGSRRSVERALQILEGVAAEASRAQREPVSIAELVVGLQCGGSDGLSGITANPALGAAVDLLADCGGTAILSETPEIYGAEHLLMRRASPEVAAKLGRLITWWEEYTAKHGASVDNNPSPGNKRGGLTTILEKSLGAVAKGGQSPLRAVYDYAERVTERGLVYMDTPGYDPVSATGQVAGGANLIAFTTGRGSCFGSRPAPSIKLASSSALYAAMEEDMDLDCGTIATGVETIPALGRRIFEALISTASGEPTKSEEFGYGDNEFAPWRLGAVL